VTGLARAVVTALRREQLGFLAAALAYYAFVAAVPLLIVAIAVAGALGGGAFANSVVGTVQEVLTEEAAAVLDRALTSGSGREGATALGLVVLGWSGLRLFRALDHAFARVYGRSSEPTLLEQFTDATVGLLGLGAGVVGTVALSWVVPLSRLPLVGLLGTLVSAAVLTAVFLPIYYVLPDTDVALVTVLPGAAVAGGGWTVLGTVFSVDAGLAGGFQLYGVLGGVLLLLTWLYFGALLVVAGAVLNATLAGVGRDRQLQHASRRGGG
jgi:YihY family inner membrane protein